MGLPGRRPRRSSDLGRGGGLPNVMWAVAVLIGLTGNSHIDMQTHIYLYNMYVYIYICVYVHTHEFIYLLLFLCNPLQGVLTMAHMDIDISEEGVQGCVAFLGCRRS